MMKPGSVVWRIEEATEFHTSTILFAVVLAVMENGVEVELYTNHQHEVWLRGECHRSHDPKINDAIRGLVNTSKIPKPIKPTPEPEPEPTEPTNIQTKHWDYPDNS